MKTTLALSWKALVSKLHPPLSMSRRESQKLLQSLSFSFQKRLDGEYPFRLDDTSHHANTHIQSILSSPLLGSTPRRCRTLSLDQLRDRNVSMRGLRYWIHQPLDAFQHGVSSGTASIETGKLCLELQLKKCLAFSVSELGGEIDTEGTGSVMLSWLWSSGMEESGQHVQDLRFISLLTIFLVIEQRYDVIFNWFSQCRNYGRDLADEASQRNHMAQANLLVQLVRSETAYGAGLAAAMVHFTQYFRRKTIDSISVSRKIYDPAGSFLAHELADPGRAEVVPEDILWSFTTTTRGWVDNSSLANVILHVYHPEKPRPDIALRFLQQLTTEKLESFSSSHRRRLIRTSLKTAELLLASNQKIGAHWIMHFIQTNFAEEVGARVSATQATRSEEKSRVEEEATHLRLLETLGVN